MSARRRSPKHPRTRDIKTDAEHAAELKFLQQKYARPWGWYWVGGPDNWEPALFGPKGWTPARSVSSAYFTDEEVGQIGPALSKPTPASVAVNCVACEDKPVAENDPCAVCGKSCLPALVVGEAAIPAGVVAQMIADAIATTEARLTLSKPTPVEAGALDWLRVAKLAGQFGIRYRTNTALEQFLAALSETLPVEREA